MGILNTLRLKIGIVLLLMDTVTAQVDKCSPFRFIGSAEKDYPNCGKSFYPNTGPEVGGTVIEIDNGKGRECPIAFNVKIFCRFESTTTDFFAIVPGLILRFKEETIECVSPFYGAEGLMKVSYTALPSTCPSIDDAVWIVVANGAVFFHYLGDRPGVVASNVIPNTPNIPQSRLFLADSQIKVDWNSVALSLGNGRDMIPAAFYGEGYYTMDVSVDILVYNNAKRSSGYPFDKIPNLSNLVVDPDSSSYNLIVPQKDISPYYFKWGNSEEDVALIIIQVVESTDQFWNEENDEEPWILASRHSALLAVFPPNYNDFHGKPCPITFDNDCSNTDEKYECPITFTLAKNTPVPAWAEDPKCRHPSGNFTCDPKINLKVDLYNTCGDTELDQLPLFDGCPDDVDDFIIDYIDDTDGCGCEIFHPGAIGCVKFERRQCCYEESNGLLTTYQDGGGRLECQIADDKKTELEAVDRFIFDDLPYLFCCRFSGRCETYLPKFPVILNATGVTGVIGDYIFPTVAARSFGDPHLITFDELPYDFNGFGEYIAACEGAANLTLKELCDFCGPTGERLTRDREGISIHYRFAPLKAGQPATVTVGVAVEDPSHENGEKSLVIIQGGSRRLDVYNGDELVEFQRIGKRNRIRQVVGNTIINRPFDTTLYEFVMIIVFESGLRLKITEFRGVIFPELTRPPGRNNFVGLLGRPDGNQTNDFTTSLGVVMNITRSNGTSFNALQTENIFDNFGQTWMISNSDMEISSLFRHTPDREKDFRKFFQPCYRPNFGVNSTESSPTDFPCRTQVPSISPSPSLTNSPAMPIIPFNNLTQLPSLSTSPSRFPTNSPVIPVIPFNNSSANDRRLQIEEDRRLQIEEDVCGVIQNLFIKEACQFDLLTLNDPELVGASSSSAVEAEEIVKELTNTPPTILGSGLFQNASVQIEDTFSFQIIATDTEGDTLSVQLKTNEIADGSFVLSDDIAETGIASLEFLGNMIPGDYRAQVTVTDGLIPVIVSRSVFVIPPPTPSPTSLPSASPSVSPSTSPSTLPSTSPSILPSMSPSTSPSTFPTAPPSTSPSTLPSTLPSSPSSISLCTDDDDFKFKTPNGKRKKCAWIAKNFLARKFFCDEKIRVRTHCLLTCNNCKISKSPTASPTPSTKSNKNRIKSKKKAKKRSKK